MTHYIFAEKQAHTRKIIRRERWETFAAFLTFGALVGLTGAIYGSFLRGDVYDEVRSHDELSRFATLLDSSEWLEEELGDKAHQFTIIAPTDQAFAKYPIAFRSDSMELDDGRLIEVEGTTYLLQSESYVLRTQVMPTDVPVEYPLTVPAASGETISLSRQDMPTGSTLMVNGVPVRDQLIADNGVIYLVDNLINPLPGQDVAHR